MSASRNFVQSTSLAALLLLTVGSSISLAAPQAPLTTGDKCTVTSGPNKGETGTYGDDGWCEGDWGGTECIGTKCKATAALNHRNKAVHASQPNFAKKKFKFRTFSTAATLKN